MISKRLDKVIEGKDRIFLLDLSWHLHRNYHSFSWMGVNINGYVRPTGHLYGVLYTIETLRTKFPDCGIVLCQDGIPAERQEIAGQLGSGYKDGRAELAFDFYKDIQLLESACYLSSNVYWAFNSDKESDDIMYALAKQIEEISDIPVFIYSGDNDLLQAIDEQVKVVRKTTQNGDLIEIGEYEVTQSEEFTKKFHGVNPKHLPFFRCIVGDSSDNIKGITRFPRALAKEIAMSSNCLEDVFKFQGVTQTEMKYISALSENREVIELNYKLMKLSSDFEVNIVRRRPDVDKVLSALKELQLNKYLRYLGVK